MREIFLNADSVRVWLQIGLNFAFIKIFKRLGQPRFSTLKVGSSKTTCPVLLLFLVQYSWSCPLLPFLYGSEGRQKSFERGNYPSSLLGWVSSNIPKPYRLYVQQRPCADVSYLIGEMMNQLSGSSVSVITLRVERGVLFRVCATKAGSRNFMFNF